MNHYLLLNFFTNISSSQLFNQLEKVSSYEQIHINFQPCIKTNDSYLDWLSVIKKNSPTSDIHLYAHDLKEVSKAQELGIKVHYCFFNENIKVFDEFRVKLDQSPDAEVFWILNNDILYQEVDNYVKLLDSFNRPVCPVISPLLRADIQDTEQLRQWIKALHERWHNPLLEKELSLPLSSWEYNDYWSIQDEHIEKSFLVMGVFGDIAVNDSSTVINTKTLLKTKDCQGCEYFDSCKERGIGNIIHQLGLKGCTAYQILNSSQ